jgi:hypothetical protein
MHIERTQVEINSAKPKGNRKRQKNKGYIHKIRSQGCTLSKDYDDYLFWKILGIP